LGACYLCFGLHSLLYDKPSFQQLVLPSAQLAWMLLQYEQQAVEAEQSSSSSSSSRNASLSKPQLARLGGTPGAVLEFIHGFGHVVFVGLSTFLAPSADHLLESDEVAQLLLAFTALTVGAAHKKLAADAAADRSASRQAGQRSSSSSGKSSSSRGRSTAAAAAAAAAALAAPAGGGVPASHLQLLAALSPPLH
jgi:hypothetical protein